MQTPPTSAPPLRRVVILGHTGFIGREVKRVLEDRRQAGLEIVADALPRIELTRDKDISALVPWLDAHTAIVMCAGIKRQLGDNLDIFQKNLSMVVNLAHILQDHPIARVVYLSSSAIYGEEIDDLNLSEATPARPASYYGLAKFVSEQLLRKAVDTTPHGTLAVLRPPLVYGCRDGGAIYGPSGFARAAIEGKPIVLWGDGSELREFVLVDDLAEVICQLTFLDFDGVVNIATGHSRTYLDALDVLRQRLGRPLTVQQRSRSRKKVDNGYDTSLLRRLLPEFRFTNLEDGIARTLKEHGIALAAGRLISERKTA